VPARRAGRDQVEINETRYVLLAENSDVASWSYLSLVPLDIYADRFTDLSRFTIIAFIACMLLGGLSIYWFAVARYRPVHNLLELLQPNDTGSVSVQSDEFAVITATLEMTLAEDKLLRQEVRRTKPIIAQRYLQELLKARIKDDRDARVELEKLGVVFEHPYLTVVLVEVEAIDGSDAAAAVPVDRDLPGEVYLLRDIDGAFCAIVNHDSWSTANVAETLLRNKRAAESQYPLVWSVGLSETASRSADISQLYRHARRALDFRLVKGRNAPILYELIRSSNQSYYYPIQQETKLMNSIRAGDSQIAAAIIEDIYAQNFTDTPLSLEMARCLMFDLIATMVKTVNSIVTPEEDGAFWGRVRPITRLMKCNSLEHLKTEIGSTLLQTCAYVLEHRTSHTDQLRRDILAYIHEHYADPNLCTDQVAAALNRNSAYLARFFREQMHVGMSNYIKKRRVEAAKQALRQEDVTLNELAGRVGFGGSNALIRAFKDTEGITPGQFRESITV
jgi:AraC-like DNA-binding protein